MPTPSALKLTTTPLAILNPIRSAIQMLGALAWIPEGEVVEAHHIIKPTLSFGLAEFLQYFEEIWIGTPTSPARYRPSQWNQYKAILSVILRRSSNVVEGWHNGFYILQPRGMLSPLPPHLLRGYAQRKGNHISQDCCS